MGRGGGGGGHSGGGHSSFSRSGGGHSSSHRGGASSHRGGSSSLGSFHGGHHTYRYHGTTYVLRSASWVWYFAIAIVIFICIMNTRPDTSFSIQRSTVQRQPLPASASTTINKWFSDDWGWLGSGKTTTDGLRYFQQKTGVQVYVVVTDDLAGRSIERYADEVYNDVFGTDEGHAVFVWYEGHSSYSDDGDGNYKTWLQVGTAAGAVLDDEAIEIVLDFFDQCYATDSLNEDELMGRTFHYAADRMMTVTKSPLGIIIVTSLVFVTAVVVLAIVKAVLKRNKEKAEERQRILNTPLESASTAEDKTLEDKYL